MWVGEIRPTYLTEGSEVIMTPEVSPREGESQDAMVRRFQRVVQMDGILREARASQTFMSKRDAANLKSKRAARRKRLGK